MDVLALCAPVLASIVLAATLVLVSVQHSRAQVTWAAERERLQHLIVARDGREYAQIRRASEPKPPREPDENADMVQVGLG